MPFFAPLIGGAASALLGGLLGSGKKPQIPAFKSIDVDAEQKAAIAGNTKNFSESAELTTRTNAYNQDELRRMLRVAIPNYDAIVGKQGELVQSFLSGELPKDVVGQIQRNSAERAGASGYGGSGMGRNLEARDLGLTSLQLTQQGLNAAERWLAGTKALAVPGQFDVSAMFLSPAQRVSATVANNTGQFNRDLMAANVAAAPDPTRSAIGSLFSQVGGSLFGVGLTGMFGGTTTPALAPVGTSSTGNSIFGPLMPILPNDNRA
jgi:hypothetical protein